MASDGQIKIDAKIDTSDVDKGLEELKNKLLNAATGANKLDKSLDKVEETADNTADTIQNVAKETKKAGNEIENVAKKNKKAAEESENLVDKLKEIFKKGGTVATVMGTVAKATQKAAQMIRETSDAYKVQANAEKLLTQAAANNPYINQDAVNSLKDFASEMQGVTNLGDEFIIGFESQLVAAGRTQSQIEKIIKTAADVAASGAMSFESAVVNLNKTFGGLAGELGETMPELKNLTTEELEQGKAVDLLAKKYNGMASEIVDAKTQAQNAKGDFEEAIGALTAPTANAWDNFWKSFYENGIRAINWINDRLETLNFSNQDFIKNIVDFSRQTIDDPTKTFAERSGLAFQTTEYLSRGQELLEQKQRVKDLTDEEAEALFQIKILLNKRAEQEKYAREEQEKQNKLIDDQITKEKQLADAKKQLNNEATNIITSTQSSLKQEIERIEKEAELTGEAIDQQAIYNSYKKAYIDLTTKGIRIDEQGLLHNPVTEENKAAKELLDSLEEKQKKAEEYNRTLEERKRIEQDTQDAPELLEKVKGLREDELEQYENQQRALTELKDEIYKNDVLKEEQKEAAIAEIDKAYAENKKQFLDKQAEEENERRQEQIETLKGYSNDLVNISKDAANLALEFTKLQSGNELAELEKKYKAGEVGEEQYNEKKKEIRKKAAQDEYRANMASWAMSLAQATANIAEGVTKALAAPFPMNIANGAIVSAAGAVQLASIIGSKPVPPAFAKGGIVGGTSYHGDNISARVNSGEMVLTMAQQRALFDVANGSGTMGAPNITVNNSAANLVDVTPSISQNNINVMIDARVKEGLQNGAYNESLTMAQQGQNGTYYGI